MRLPSTQIQRGLTFNITPLIDVVFLLIIFFLVASHFIRNETLEPVELPVASKGRQEEESTSRVVITITPDQRLLLAGMEVTVEEIENKLQMMSAEHGAESTELRIRGDKQVPYSSVEPILLRATRCGITKVRIAVKVSNE